MKPVIEVDHLYKKYQIGEKQRYYSLRDSIANFTKSPFRAINKPSKNEFWALKNISFKVAPGEAVGIIGKNGAGKSTLLKILSQITQPTKGKITLRGRVASLLEVGTGFHPELTGRENIYLNGAILGMKRIEIKKRFDQIVDFAEIIKFLDTPVKHYSSGMYMRLAFAVAAHLESEILLIDEVLAVGDAQFQKKCLGKMEEISKDYGRTVIFVSHNMGSIVNLCKKTILLDDGKSVLYADSAKAVSKYLSSARQKERGFFPRNNYNREKDLITSAELLNNKMKQVSSFQYGEDFYIKLKTNPALKQKFGVEIRIKNSRQEIVAYTSSWINSKSHRRTYRSGQTILIYLPKIKFTEDTYTVDFICRIPYMEHIDNWWDSVNFTITNCQPGDSPVPIKVSENLGSLIISDAVFSLI